MNRFKKRSNESEWMDDMSISGTELNQTLDQIAALNQWLGGNTITLNGVKQLVQGHENSKPIHIIDLGCGNGDQLRALAKLGKKHNFRFKLTGVDANEATIQHAKFCSQTFPEIEYLTMNFFSKQFEILEYDIALATLVLHHFEQQDLFTLLQIVVKQSNRGVVINDLQRSAVSYYLFKFISPLIKSERAKQDGLISILRGFKKTELQRFSNQLKLNSTIRWKWAFRYQWIIRK